VEADPRRTIRGSESGTVTCPGIPTRVKAREKWPGGTGVPGPCEMDRLYRAEDFTGTCHRLPRGGSLLLASCDQEVRRRAGSVRDAKKWCGSSKPTVSRVTPPVPGFRNLGRTQSVKADSCYCEPAWGSAIQRFWTNLKMAAATVRRRNRTGKKDTDCRGLSVSGGRRREKGPAMTAETQ
jgi:hypothetical protein